jgi:hypothetical protein
MFRKVRARPNGDVVFVYDTFSEIMPKDGPPIITLKRELDGLFDVPVGVLRSSCQSRTDELFDDL